LINFIENSKNRHFVFFQKYKNVKQQSSQNVNKFVTYLETLEANFDKYIERQRRNHLLHKLRKNLRKKINDVTQIFETKNTLVTLAQRIKSTILSRFKILNKISKKKLFFKSRNFKESFYNQKQEKTISTSKTHDVFTIANR